MGVLIEFLPYVRVIYPLAAIFFALFVFRKPADAFLFSLVLGVGLLVVDLASGRMTTFFFLYAVLVASISVLCFFAKRLRANMTT